MGFLSLLILRTCDLFLLLFELESGVFIKEIVNSEYYVAFKPVSFLVLSLFAESGPEGF